MSADETKTGDPVADAVAAAMASINAAKPGADVPKAQIAAAAPPPPEEPQEMQQPLPDPDVPALQPSFNGRARDTFAIYGSGFGDIRGVVTIGGFQCRITSWQDHAIKGHVPEMLTAGATELTINGSQPVLVRLTR